MPCHLTVLISGRLNHSEKFSGHVVQTCLVLCAQNRLSGVHESIQVNLGPTTCFFMMVSLR